MHVHISRHRNHGYVPADDCLCFALIYLCMMVCMWLLCECDVCFLFDNATLDYMYMYVCIYVCIYIDNATLDYILVIWVCMVEVTSLFPEYLPGTQGILAYLLETDVSFSVLCLCVYEFSLDLFCTFILMYIL